MAKNDALTSIRTRPAKTKTGAVTPQRTKAVAGQVKNAAGGYVFSIDDEARLHRFLTLGVEGGTFYVSERKLAKENAQVVLRAAEQAPLTLVKAIVNVSVNGRAAKQDPAIFALAVAAASPDVAGRRAALAALPQVCRTGTALFKFVTYAEQFRGWGRAMRAGVGSWYDGMEADKLAIQLVKYRQREGWTHRDVLRLAHTEGASAEHRAMYNYIAGRTTLDREGEPVGADLPEVILAFEALKRAEDVGTVRKLAEVDGVTWEMIPDRWLNEAGVWRTLIDRGLPIGALIRQLPRLTKLGLAEGEAGRRLVADLTDVEKLRRGRIHPLQVLVAQKTYARGRSDRGDNTWTPSRMITDGLDKAFYASFGAVTPANKTTILGIDCSGSMGWGYSGSTVSGVSSLSCLEACAVMAMVTGATEPDVGYIGFDTRAWSLDISPRRRLDDNLAYLRTQVRGGTDVSQPIQMAVAKGIKADTFIILTDGETWAGRKHVYQAMDLYRKRINPDARLAVCAMTSTDTSVVAPFDPLSLDISGMDLATPQILADFSAGRI
ncbi:Ro-like RNA binding protein [Mycobacterium phage ScoobyDoobyDoo]|nr:Ro-like RNA binding protein [Mycobacterium phage ScoobyDoobyDoo]